MSEGDEFVDHILEYYDFTTVCKLAFFGEPLFFSKYTIEMHIDLLLSCQYSTLLMDELLDAVIMGCVRNKYFLKMALTAVFHGQIPPGIECILYSYDIPVINYFFPSENIAISTFWCNFNYPSLDTCHMMIERYPETKYKIAFLSLVYNDPILYRKCYLKQACDGVYSLALFLDNREVIEHQKNLVRGFNYFKTLRYFSNAHPCCTIFGPLDELCFFKFLNAIKFQDIQEEEQYNKINCLKYIPRDALSKDIPEEYAYKKTLDIEVYHKDGRFIPYTGVRIRCDFLAYCKNDAYLYNVLYLRTLWSDYSRFDQDTKVVIDKYRHRLLPEINLYIVAKKYYNTYLVEVMEELYHSTKKFYRFLDIENQCFVYEELDIKIEDIKVEKFNIWTGDELKIY